MFHSFRDINLFQMSDFKLSGLLSCLPPSRGYRSPEYVPVSLISVKIQTNVMNFIAQVRRFLNSDYVLPGFTYILAHMMTSISNILAL